MRRRAWFSIATLGALLALIPAGTAGAVTLGSTTQPSGSAPSGCGPDVIGQEKSDPSTPYAMPIGGHITQWQINTVGATAGASVKLVVLRPVSGEKYEVVGVDDRTLPAPLPAGGVATFALGSPIAVNAKDTLGLYAPSGGVICYFSGGSTPTDANLFALASSGVPATGQTLSKASSSSPGGYTMNVAVTLVTTQDLSVTAAAGPANAAVGSLAQLTASVTNGGPDMQPITFTDTVPAGLAIQSAVAGSGNCTVSGQAVTCTISGLAPGQSAPVVITVLPSSPGSYANAATVATTNGVSDPNSANNGANATLIVVAAPLIQKCFLPKFTSTSLSFVKQLLPLLGCRVGKVTKVSSRKVHKGLVISTTPGHGTFAAGTAVSIKVSSGPPKKKKKKKHH